MICNKSVAEAKAIKNEDLISALGGLPTTSLHASQLVIDALDRALKQITT
jgi:NifU-like protein involved in Fe-S cluster formation